MSSSYRVYLSFYRQSICDAWLHQNKIPHSKTCCSKLSHTGPGTRRRMTKRMGETRGRDLVQGGGHENQARVVRGESNEISQAGSDSIPGLVQPPVAED